MNPKAVWTSSRAVVVEVDPKGLYSLDVPCQMTLNGKDLGETSVVETYIDGLEPAKAYELTLKQGECVETLQFETEAETFSFNVRDFGAAGDGERDDTGSIQAAILCCPEHGHVLIPAGDYKVSSIFLKNYVSVELAEGATLKAMYAREERAYMPGTALGAAGAGYNGTGKLPLGTWEGESTRMFCGIVTGMGVKGARLYGRGVLDGQASYENWWYDHKRIRVAARPHMLFLSECDGFSMVGLTVRDSPSWNLHPTLSTNLEFRCLSIEGPKVSPNTDGFDPESCDGIVVSGCVFSVGDDCIAIKSGKLQMDRDLRPPTSNMEVCHCHMHDGHGGVVLGSEAAGGVRDLYVHDCLFERTDRGLRVKTRRGRGKDSIYENILFERIKMVDVLTPFTVNSFYFCDDDGKTDYVQCREPLPVDDRTPDLRTFVFKNIDATGAHLAASHIVGIPEKPIQGIEFHNVRVSYADQVTPEVPEMACGIPEMSKRGFIVEHVEKLVLDNVEVIGCEGEAFELADVGEVQQ